MPWRDSAGRVVTPTCRGHVRHWFTVRARLAGGTGVRTPTCQRCGAPNPRPLDAEELELYNDVTRRGRDN